MLGDKVIERQLQRLIPEAGESRTIIELRCKLEMRSLFLRASLALNTALFAGAFIQLLRVTGVL